MYTHIKGFEILFTYPLPWLFSWLFCDLWLITNKAVKDPRPHLEDSVVHTEAKLSKGIRVTIDQLGRVSNLISSFRSSFWECNSDKCLKRSLEARRFENENVNRLENDWVDRGVERAQACSNDGAGA